MRRMCRKSIQHSKGLKNYYKFVLVKQETRVLHFYILRFCILRFIAYSTRQFPLSRPKCPYYLSAKFQAADFQKERSDCFIISIHLNTTF